MALVNTINYDTAGNFTYDSSVVEFSGSVARLIDRRDDSTFFASFRDTINGNWGDGSLTGAANASAGISSNRLILTSANQRVDFDADDNADHAQTLTIRFKLTPQYSTAPSNKQAWVTIQKANSRQNAIELTHETSGNINIFINDNASSTILNSNFGGWSPTAGTEYEIELNCDFTGGAQRLFIDGVQQGSTKTGTGTRNSVNIDQLRVGDLFNNSTPNPNFHLRHLKVYDSVQHTAADTPASQIDYKYTVSEPTVVTNAAVDTDGISAFSETAASVSGGSVKYALVVNNQDKYWSGSAWVDSNGTSAQANTASEINSNIGSYDISSGVKVKVKAFLISDGVAQTSIETVSYDYDFFAPTPADPSNCAVYGFIRNFDLALPDIAITGVIVENPAPFFNGQYVVQPFKKTISVNSEGYFETTVIETATAGKKYVFRLVYKDATGRSQTQTLGEAEVPNVGSKALSTLTFS